MKIISAFCLLFFCLESNGQLGEWTWMKGDSIYNSPGFYIAQAQTSSLNNPRARQRTIGFTDANHDFWVFGGGLFDPATPAFYELMGDLWKYSPSNNQWLWVRGDDTYPNFLGNYGTRGVSSPTNNPPAREWSQGWTDSSGNFWIFGGDIAYYNSINGWSKYVGDDFWKYNIATNQWTWINGHSYFSSTYSYHGIKGVPSLLNYPGARDRATTWTDKAGNLWLFGGYGKDGNDSLGNLNDLWMFNTSTNLWTWISGDSTKFSIGNYGVKGVEAANYAPRSRTCGQGWTDSSGNLWLFGGTQLNDLWRFNVSSRKWAWMNGEKKLKPDANWGTKNVSTTTNTPGYFENLDYSSNLFIWIDKNDLIWLFNSQYNPYRTDNQWGIIWKYNRFINQWTWVSGDTSTFNINLSNYYGVQGVAIPNNLPISAPTNSDWVDKEGNFWLMEGAKNAMWKLSQGLVTPLDLLTFTGSLQSNIAHLQWTSENEQNFSHYEIERSSNSREWNKLGTANWKGGSGKNEYSYEDDLSRFTSHVSRQFYRLKMVDKDGSFTYSKIVIIRLNNQPSFSIYPNPASTSVQLQFDKSMNEKMQVKLLDMNGKVVVSGMWSVVSGVTRISTRKLPAGSYVVKVRVANDNEYSKKLVLKK